MDVSNFSGIT